MKEPYRCFLSCSGAKVPEPPEGHKWQKVIHENKVHVSTKLIQYGNVCPGRASTFVTVCLPLHVGLLFGSNRIQL